MKRLIILIFGLFATYSVSSQNIDFDAITDQFTADTARVNQQQRDMLSSDYSTMGMIEASNYSEQEYDKLLNKYYKILYNALNEDGKKALKATQLNWIKLRDSDKQLVTSMRNQIYDEIGGGTIWSVISSEARADITRRRVIDLYNYLLFSDSGAR